MFPDQCRPSISRATLFRDAWAIMLNRRDNTNDMTYGAAHLGHKAHVESVGFVVGPVVTLVPV